MRFFVLPALLFAFCLLAACRPAAAPVSVSNKPISINNIPQTNVPLPPLKNVENLGWRTFAGEKKTLGDYRGKVVVLDFWATYCPPCLEEIPHLNDLQAKYGDALQIVGLHVGGEEDQPKVPAFIEKLKINYAIAYPEDDLLRILLGTDDSIPQTFVFDKTGKLIKKEVGFDNIIKANLTDAIEQAVKISADTQ